MNTEVTIVLLSHKSKNLIVDFIKNIYNKFSIIIIDNSNQSSLKEEIEKNYPNIRLEIVKNNGYGAAINYASKLIKTDYFIISNPDIIGLNEINIKEFIETAKSLNNEFSSLGPRFIDADKKSHLQSKENIDVAEMKFISGACMFFNKKIFDSLNGFDENFFLYFEESDYCLRAIKKNYQVNKVKVRHNVGSSVIVENKNEKKELDKLYTWHFIWSKYYYHRKHYGKLYSLIYFFPIFVRIIFRICFYTITNNRYKREKFLIRYEGLMSSIKGLSSYKRIKN